MKADAGVFFLPPNVHSFLQAIQCQHSQPGSFCRINCFWNISEGFGLILRRIDYRSGSSSNIQCSDSAHVTLPFHCSPNSPTVGPESYGSFLS